MSNSNNITTSIASAQDITVDRTKLDRISEWYSCGNSGCSGVWRDAALVLPSALLVLYLGFRAGHNVRKLHHWKSYVVIAYYALLWFTALLNLAWAIFQVLVFGFLDYSRDLLCFDVKIYDLEIHETGLFGIVD